MKISHASGAGYSNTARGVLTRHGPVLHRTIIAILEGEGLLEQATVVGPGDLIDLLPDEGFLLESRTALAWVEVPLPQE